MVDAINLEDVRAYLDKNYFRNLIAYLSCETSQSCQKQDYMKCVNLIHYQCQSLENHDFIYQVFKDLLADYVYAEIHQKLVGRAGQDLLQNLVLCWDNFTIFASNADRMFDELNKFKFIDEGRKEMIAEQCMRHFQKRVYESKQADIALAIQNLIEEDRDGRKIDKELVKKSLQILYDLGLEGPTAKRDPRTGTFSWVGRTWTNSRVLKADFEEQYLFDTRFKAQLLAIKWESELNCPEYCLQVMKFLENEETNAKQWFKCEPESFNTKQRIQST